MPSLEKSSIGKDISLLVIGALISLGTAMTTNYFNAKREDTKLMAIRKLDLNEKISKDLSKRLYFTYELYKSMRDKDTMVKVYLPQYLKSREEWNTNRACYESLLIFYYGEDIRVEFIRDVYNPEVNLGKDVTDGKIDGDIAARRARCDSSNIAFIKKLYDLTGK